MMHKKPTKKQLFFQRYVLTGAALGLYFGIFFRPAREPLFLVAPFLGLFAAIVVSVVRAFQQKSWPKLARFGQDFVLYTAVVVMIEARHIAYDLGDKVGVSIYAAVCGGVAGYFLAVNAFKQNNKGKKDK